MLYEYLVTAFKVIVGVVTNNRLLLASLIALGVLLLWVIFSLVFSFQRRLISNARTLNEYVSRNGLNNGSGQLNVYMEKMPAEFIKGFNAYQRDRKTLPSDHIKKFESVDLELMGGVFNQNKSVIKTYINFIFSILFLLSIAILSNQTALTGYILAEALLLPLMFLAVAKIIYYCYTAIRQHLYRVAVEEFNELLANMDSWAETNKPLALQVKEQIEVPAENISVEIVEDNNVKDDNIDAFYADFDKIIKEAQEKEAKRKEEQALAEKIESEQVVEIKEQMQEEPQVEEIKEVEDTKQLEPVQVSVQEVDEKQVEEQSKQTAVKKQMNAPKQKQEKVAKVENKEMQKEEVKIEEAQAEQEKPKRGRGRPKKETPANGELIITNDQQFEETLVRAEKLMRKNEEPLSQSQTKRIEKQIKQLIDAMSKYKEGK